MSGLLKGGVQVLKHERLGSSSRQDGCGIGQEGKCNQQAIEIHDRTVSKWTEPMVQSHGGLVKYQTCVIFCQSTVTSRETITYPN